MGTLGYRLHQERKERDQQGQGWKTEPRATREQREVPGVEGVTHDTVPGGESQPACQELCDIKVFISRLRGAAGAFKEGIDWVRYMLSKAPVVRVEGRHSQANRAGEVAEVCTKARKPGGDGGERRKWCRKLRGRL